MKSGNNVTFRKIKSYKIPDNAVVKIYESDSKIIKKYSHNNSGNLRLFTRLSRKVYKINGKDIIKNYPNNVLKTKKRIKENMRNLKQLIDLHFSSLHNTIFITLTCKDNVQSLNVIKDYWNRFIRKLKLRYSKYELCYIYKFERNQTGIWHIHILVRDMLNKRIDMNNTDISKLWGKGYTYTQTVRKDKFNVNYEKKDIVKSTSIEKISSYMSKTTQLYNIPNYSKIWGHSKNLKRPKPITIKNEYAQEVIKEIDATLESRKTLDIIINDIAVNRCDESIYIKKKDTSKNVFINNHEDKT